ncbi:hypothetical protein NFI96_005237, partial [Prochilodus magdalenae]
GNKVIISKMDLPPGEQPLTLSTTDVCHTLRRVSARKAAGPDEFADDITVIGLIRGDDETAYRDEVQHLAAWCDDNNLVLNTQKTKEVIVDFRKSRNQAHTPIHISGAEVECVYNFKFLGVHISEDLTWSLNSSTMVKKVQQRLYFLRSLKKAHLCPRILVDFYRCTIESILTNCISVWYGSCSASDR